PASHIIGVLSLDDVKASDPGADVNAHALGDLGLDGKAGLLQGKVRAGHGRLNEPAHLLHFFFFDELEGVKAFEFGGNRRGKTVGVKLRDRAYAAPAGQDVFPAFLRADPDSAYQPHARHNNSSCQNLTPPDQYS